MAIEQPSYAISLKRFFEGTLSALRANAKSNAQLAAELEAELARRQTPNKSTARWEEDRKIFSKKLVRFRPRLIGAFGAYAALSRQSFSDVEYQGGVPLFRMLWFLGSAQDDLIDEQAPAENVTVPDAKQLRRAIFGPEMIFYQAAFTVIGDKLARSSMSAEQKRYIKVKLSEWFRFLVHQEAAIMQKRLHELTFDECTRYREAQNQKIGEALIACLNGARCLDLRFQALERSVPKLSFRTQIIDDIADIPEDLGNGRPSYAIGALVDHPEELKAMREYLQVHAVGKVTSALFEHLAPKSSSQVRKQFDAYGEALKQEGITGSMLASIGNVIFKYFPTFRNAMYRINPTYGNF